MPDAIARHLGGRLEAVAWVVTTAAYVVFGRSGVP